MRKGQLEKIPYLLVVGDKEVESQTVAVRQRGGANLGSHPIDVFQRDLLAEVHERRLSRPIG